MSYRVEYANSSRAKCVGPVCTKEGTKIVKGELRFGTFVDTGTFASFKWRHWREGCMTDKVIANIKEKYDDINDLDGLDELKDEDKDMIKEAIERGSVDKDGPKPKEPSPKKPRAPRKEKAAPEDEEDEEHEGDQPDPLDEPADKKRRGGNLEEDEGEKPAKKRGKSSNGGEKAETKPKVSAKKKNSKTSDDVNVPIPGAEDENLNIAEQKSVPAPAKAGRKRKSEVPSEEVKTATGMASAKGAAKAPPADTEAEHTVTESAEPVKKGRAKANKTATVAEDGAESGVNKETTKPKRGRPRKEVVEKELGDKEETTKKRKGKKGTA